MKHNTEHPETLTCKCHEKAEEARILKKVEHAIHLMLLIESQKHWALSMCRNDEAAFDRFLGLS